MIENQLKTILTIAEASSLSTASKNLYVSQPYLTKIVKTIEKKYHITIFKRSKNGIEATEEGRRFIVKAKEIMEKVDELSKIKNKTNTTRLTISSFPSSYTMQAYIKYMKKVDKTNVLSRCSYYEKNIMEVINDVYLQTCDIGIIFMKDSFIKENSKYFYNKNIEYKKLFDTEPSILCRKNHPLLKIKKPTLSDLYKYRLVAFSTKYNIHLGKLDEGYYNQDSMSTVIDYDKFIHITYVQNRGPMHNILKATDSIAIGNHTSSKTNELFDLSCTPLKKYIHNINSEEFNNSMYYIHLKTKPLSQYAKMYLSILQSYQ